MSLPKAAHPVATASLANYDGTAGTLVDTNIWIDCIDTASPWHDWAMDQLQACSERAPLHINLIVYTELLIPGPDVDALDALLNVYETLRTPLPWASASLAAAAYGQYRRQGGAKTKPLPDFFVGAHAAVANLSVLTRDPKPYQNYFARLTVIAP
jgi:predicted nucleic acid-binding protein